MRLSNEANKNLREDDLRILNSVLNKHNPYVCSYKTTHQNIEEDRALALGENRPQHNFLMRFDNKPPADPRRFDDPTTSEVAAVFETADGALPSHRHVTVYERQKRLQNIDYDSMHCDPMSYTLTWPSGEPG